MDRPRALDRDVPAYSFERLARLRGLTMVAVRGVYLLVATPRLVLHDGAQWWLDTGANVILWGTVGAAVLANRHRINWPARWLWAVTITSAVPLAIGYSFSSKVDAGQWAGGLAVNTAVVLACPAIARRSWLAMSAVLAGSQLVGLLASGSGDVMSMRLRDLCIATGFALVARYFCEVLDGSVRDAERAWAAARETGRQLEFERSRVLLHDHAAVLGLLADPDLPAEVAEVVRRQASQAATEIRTFLARDVPVSVQSARGCARTLARVVDDVVEEFEDLPIESHTALARHELEAGPAEAVRLAVRTLLSNVRRHSAAEHVVIQAHSSGDGSMWQVVVSDDGVGFDTCTTPLGFGLSHQVTAALRSWGMRAQIHSCPGVGTTVTLAKKCPPQYEESDE